MKGMTEGFTRAQIDLRRIGAEEVFFQRPLGDSEEPVEFRAWKIPRTIAMPPATAEGDDTSNLKGSESDEDGPGQPDRQSELNSMAS